VIGPVRGVDEVRLGAEGPGERQEGRVVAGSEATPAARTRSIPETNFTS